MTQLKFSATASSNSQEMDSTNDRLDLTQQLRTEADLEMIGSSEPKQLTITETGLKQTFQVSSQVSGLRSQVSMTTEVNNDNYVEGSL